MTAAAGTVTIRELVEAQVAENGCGVAVMAPGRQPLSYADLYAQMQATAGALAALGFGRGDRIAMALRDGPEAVTATLAVAACASCVPLNPAASKEELRILLKQGNCAAVLTVPAAVPHAAAAARELGVPVIELQAEAGIAGLFQIRGEGRGAAAQLEAAGAGDIALVLPTSGTTGRPKIIPLTQADACEHGLRVRAYLDLTAGDRFLNLMPVFHSGGIMPVLATFFAGACGFYPEEGAAGDVMRWVEEFRPTWLGAVPPAWSGILAEARRRGARRVGLSGLFTCGAPLPAAVLEGLEGTLGVPLQNSYGATECGGITLQPMPPRPRKESSVGVSVGLEIGVMGEAGRVLPSGQAGEVVVRGAGTFRGYENDAEATAAAFRDGWYRTGDEGYLDADGYLFLTGRMKELVNRGGEKIAPQEVEAVLLRHPAVTDAAAFAVPHAELGEDLAAAVVIREGAGATEAEIRRFTAQHLAEIKVPRRIVRLAEIPRGAAGKVQRALLAEQCAGELERGARAKSHEPPATPMEKRLAAIWAEMLGVASVGAEDDFFDLGGHSLLATRILARVGREFGTQLPADLLFRTPTIRRLASVLGDSSEVARELSRAVMLQPGASGPPLFMVQPFALFRTLARKLGGGQPVVGLALPEREELPARFGVEDIARNLVGLVRRLQPEGPYFLGGWCAEGQVALEMGRQLRKDGQEVALVALLDTPNAARIPGKPRLLRGIEARLWNSRFHLANLRNLTLAEQAAYIRQRLTIVLKKVLRAAAARVRGAERFDDGTGRWLRTTIRVPMHDYVPKPYCGKLALMASDWWRSEDPTFGWGNLAPALTVHKVPGDHLTMFLEPHVNILAEKMAQELAMAREAILKEQRV